MNQRDRIAKYYNNCVASQGNSVDAVGWFSSETQLVRFDSLVTIDHLCNRNILDVGCGLGHFYKYVSDYFPGVKYTGIDVSKEMVSLASKNWPDGIFELKDIDDLDIFQKYDYVFSSGAFNMNTGDNYNYLDQKIKIMFALAEEGLAFNVLSSYASEEEKDPFFFYYEPEKIFKMCKHITKHVQLRHDYLDNDMTIVMYK